ncbi:methionine--tRNA ligase [Paenibacillus cellulosilyticus]|uniref:methionine--tRNA ligase n=1 Tax=Paenibacillus cellulosilyticus TaxID=375489 RepID=A0A2V2YV08_9BACL|nr:methionine--tRNA ligase [Paenibacillus cellulosilyticus]
MWIEAVSGYLSASQQWAVDQGKSWEPFWHNDESASDARSSITAYYVHGKDNIPFHTLIWPAILLGAGGLHLPDRIVSCEHLTLEGQKFSTSRNWAVWVPDLLSRYDPDSIRYFLIANGPEKKEADFSWREFIHSHNGELLGAYGNFVNRTLAFIAKSFGSQVPEGELAEIWQGKLQDCYDQAGRLIEEARLKEALDTIFAYVRQANKHFDEEQPWVTVKDNPAACKNTLYTCVQIIANLANLLQPFIPFSSGKVRELLALEQAEWKFVSVEPGRAIGQVELLFERIDTARIDEETTRLNNENEQNH